MAPLDVALVGQGAGGDDPALGDQRRARRRLPQLVPQLVDRAVALQGPVAVGQDRMLLDRPGQGPERLQLLGRRRPLPGAVEGQAGQLPHRRHVRGLLAEGPEDAQGVGQVVPLEGVGGLAQAALDLGRDRRLDGGRHLLGDDLGHLAAPGPGRRRRRLRPGPAPAARPAGSWVHCSGCHSGGRPRSRFSGSLSSRSGAGRTTRAPLRATLPHVGGMAGSADRPPRRGGAPFARPDRPSRPAGDAADRSLRRGASSRPPAAGWPAAGRTCRPDAGPARPASWPVPAPPSPAGRASRTGLPGRSCPRGDRTADVGEGPRIDSTRKRRRPPRRWGPSQKESGGDLLSQGDSPQVPSALAGLTSVFGMGTGVTPPLWPPEICCQWARS